MLTEAEIIKGCRKGDRRAQEALFRKHHPSLLGICLRYCKNKEEAKDVLQEGFIKIFSYINTFKKQSSLATWMSKIMINTAITYYHKNSDYNNVILFHDGFKEDKYDDDLNYDDIGTDIMLKAIQGLPDEYRTIVNLFAIEGYKHKEISKMLRISESNSKIRYLRAKKLLAKKIKEFIGDQQLPNDYKLSIG